MTYFGKQNSIFGSVVPLAMFPELISDNTWIFTDWNLMIWSSDFSWVNYFLGKAIAWKVATCRDRETPADRRGPCSYGGNFQCGSRHSAPPPPLSRPGVIPPTWLEGICDQKFALQLQLYCDPGQVSETPLYGRWKSQFSFTSGLLWTWTYIPGRLNLD